MKNKIVGNKIGNLINVFINGNAYQKNFDSPETAKEFFTVMQLAQKGDKEAFFKLMGLLNRKYKAVYKGILEKDTEDRMYLKGIDIPMPELLAETFVDYIDNEYPVEALVNFWKLLVTNPDSRVREDLFKFLQNYNFSITDNGYFIGYKALEVKKQAIEDIAAFVSNQHLKYKKMKKNVANYDIVRTTTTETKEVENPAYEEGEDGNDEPEYIDQTIETKTLRAIGKGKAKKNDEVIGNLAELFKTIETLVDKRSVYQSKHSGVNGQIEQVLGVPVRQDRKLCDRDPKVECSEGLHVGSTKYVQHFADDGDKILAVLVNPAHVVAVPDYDNSKMRTSEYFPYAELERLEDSKFEEIESPYFEEDYMKYEKEELEEQLEKIAAEIEGVSIPDLTQEDYKKIIEERIVKLDTVLELN